MISLTPLASTISNSEDYGEVEYFLRRANEESVAAIRAIDSRVSASHAGMAKGYSIKSRDLIARLDAQAA